jgi:hypothetical protein
MYYKLEDYNHPIDTALAHLADIRETQSAASVDAAKHTQALGVSTEFRAPN